MSAKGKNPIKESKMKVTTPKLIRWAGLSAMVAGIIFTAIQPTHPPKSPNLGKTSPQVHAYIVFNRTKTGSNAKCQALTLILQVQKKETNK